MRTYPPRQFYLPSFKYLRKRCAYKCWSSTDTVFGSNFMNRFCNRVDPCCFSWFESNEAYFQMLIYIKYQMGYKKYVPGCTVSKIFFFGFSWGRGAAPSRGGLKKWSLGEAINYWLSNSSPSKYTLSPGFEPAGGWIISIPPSLPSFDVALKRKGYQNKIK